VAYIIESWLHPEEFLPEKLRPEWQKRFWGIVRRLCLWFSVSLACFLGALPITATWFNLFSPISLLSNIVVVPLSSLALAANLFSLMTGAWAPALTGLLNHAAWILMHAMKVISDWFAQAPYLVLHVPSPGVWFYLLYYGTLLYGLGLIISKARRQWLLEPTPFKPPPGQSLFRVFENPRARIGAHVILGFLAIGWLAQVMVQARDSTITVLPFTSGHAVVCELPMGRGTWLIDTGGEQAARFITKPYLQARGVNLVRHLVLTHGDQEHVAGAGVLREYFNIQSVHWSDVSFRFPVYRRAVQAVAHTVEKPKALPHVTRISPWRIMSSVGKRSGRADDHAVVLLGHFPACRVLLLSDLSRAGQYRLLETESDLRADIIVLGASGNSDPLTEALLDQVQPRLIIVADTQYPASARLGPVARERLKARGTPVLFTSETGAVTLHLKSDTWTYKTIFPARPVDPAGEET
jgi:competence protein ComEC